MLTKSDLRYYQNKLIRAAAEARGFACRPRFPDPEPRTADPLDRAASYHEAHVSNEFHGLRVETLGEIDAAKARLRAGKFGVCEACASDIPHTRLDAIPWARRCVGCEQIMRNAA